MAHPIKILIVGNGFGGVYALKNLHKVFHNDPGVSLSLIGTRNYFLFTPLLHEVATGGINPSNIIEPIRKVLGCCLDNFYLGKTEFIDMKNRTVQVGNDLVSYDYLILAPGSETNFYDIPGAEKHSFPLKSIADAVRIKNQAVTQMERALHIHDPEERKKMLRFVVVGGGPTGVELAAELEELVWETFWRYYPSDLIRDISILLVQKNKELVPQFDKKIQRKSLEVLRKKGIEVRLETAVVEVGASYIMLDKNEKILTDTVVWVAGIKPIELNFNGPVSRTPQGHLIVNEYFQIEGQKKIFAIGDAALFMQKNTATPIPALAQAAEKQAKALAKNIQRIQEGIAPVPFTYRNTGSLLSLGQWMAAGEIANFTFSGHIAWWIWRTVYLSKLISSRKKIRVAVDWTMNLFSPRDISEL